jgi:predicted permease
MMETLTESLVLSGAGTALGVAGAMWALPRVAAVLPPSVLDDRVPTVEPAVLGVAVAMAVGSGLLFGYLPARESARIDVRSAMSGAGRVTAAAATLRWRRLLASAQIALAVMLLVGASLLGRTLWSLYRVDLGFDPARLVIGRTSMAGIPDPGGVAVDEFFERTLERLRAAPGVAGAAVTSAIPVERALNLAVRPPSGSLVSDVRAVDWRYVSSGFFELLAVPLRAGRSFDARDTTTSPPVVIVNEAFAAAYFGREPVVGRSIRLAFGDAPAMTIVGVVGNLRNATGAGWTRTGHALKQTTAPGLFVPASQGAALVSDGGLDARWIVRSRAGTDAAASAITAVVQAAEPRLPVSGFRTMAQIIESQVAQERALFWLLAVFAGVALVLACVGTYGMVAYGVTARAREIGIRMACGATASRVLALFLRDGLTVLAAGAGVGLAGALIVAHAIRAYVWGVEPFDPTTFLGVFIAFGVVVVVAVAAPALRAARLQPTDVLRQG